LPLSARARIEVYLPDLFSLPSQELLIVFNEEFTHTFGGATLWRGLDGSYLAQDGRTVRDRINLLYTDTPFSLEENAEELVSYMAAAGRPRRPARGGSAGRCLAGLPYRVTGSCRPRSDAAFARGSARPAQAKRSEPISPASGSGIDWCRSAVVY